MASKSSSNIPAGGIRSPSPVLSPTSTLFDRSPREGRNPIRHRPIYARLASVLDSTQQEYDYDVVRGEEDTPTSQGADRAVGIGISFGPETTHTRNYSGSTTGDGLDTSYDPGAASTAARGTEAPYGSANPRAKRSTVSFSGSALQQSWSSTPDTLPLRAKSSFTDIVKSQYDGSSSIREEGDLLTNKEKIFLQATLVPHIDNFTADIQVGLH